MSSPALRFAIVGSGNMAGTYQKVLERVEQARLVAQVSRAGRGDAVPVFPSVADISVPCDAVILATPNGTHAELAVQAAERGMHVLCEKVLEVNRPAMRRMLQACHARGVTLGVAFQRRMSPDNAVLKRLLSEGALGKVLAYSMDVRFFRDQAYYDSAAYRGGYALDGGGPFMQQAAHNADLLVWWFGLPDRVSSMLGRLSHRLEAEDHGMALLHYPDGTLGSFVASTVCRPGFATRFHLHTSRGSLLMENDLFTAWDISGLPQPQSQDHSIHDGASMTVTDTAGHEAIVRDFVAAVREGRAPAVSGDEAQGATELVLRIYEANQAPPL